MGASHGQHHRGSADLPAAALNGGSGFIRSASFCKATKPGGCRGGSVKVFLRAAFAALCVNQQPLHSPTVTLLVEPQQEIPKLQLLKLLPGLSTPSPLCMFLPNHLQSQGISGRKDSQ